MHAFHLRRLSVALVVVMALGASGCSGASDAADRSGADGTTPGPTTSTTLPAVAITGTPVAKATGVPLDSPIVVKAAGGTLTDVTVTSVRPDPAVAPAEQDGDAPTTEPFVATTVSGGLSADKTTWLGGGSLLPGTTYQVTATGGGKGRRTTLQFWKFTTMVPTEELHTRVNVFEGSTYGVGMPVSVELTSPVADALRPTIEKRLTLTTSTDVKGDWRWFSSTVLHWRPAEYWPAGTKATLKVDFAGVNAGNGVWGVDGRSINFSIGDAHVSTVDASTHQMVVTSNGATVKTIPVSTGRDAFPTKSGIHVVMTREATHHMNSSTIGIPSNGPGGYDQTVKWAERISNSGEFVHSAPWSVGSQGSSNVSHGCINLSDDEGHWFYDFSLIGDVVNVVGTPATLAPDNGYGDWQIPWEQWAN